MTTLQRLRLRNDVYASNIEALLGSKARLRILRLMAKYPDHALTKYKICQTTGLKNQSAARHLTRLLEADLIQSKGTVIKRYMLNNQRDETTLLRDFFARCHLL